MSRTFIITAVERFRSGPNNSPKYWNEYRVQMCGDPDGIKVWDSFTIPTKNFGEEELPTGTKFTLTVLSEIVEGFQGMDLEECVAARVGIDLRRARQAKREAEEKIGNCGLSMKMPKRAWFDMADAVEKFEEDPNEDNAKVLLALDSALIWVRDDG